MSNNKSPLVSNDDPLLKMLVSKAIARSQNISLNGDIITLPVSGDSQLNINLDLRLFDRASFSQSELKKKSIVTISDPRFVERKSRFDEKQFQTLCLEGSEALKVFKDRKNNNNLFYMQRDPNEVPRLLVARALASLRFSEVAMSYELTVFLQSYFYDLNSIDDLYNNMVKQNASTFALDVRSRFEMCQVILNKALTGDYKTENIETIFHDDFLKDLAQLSLKITRSLHAARRAEWKVTTMTFFNQNQRPDDNMNVFEILRGSRSILNDYYFRGHIDKTVTNFFKSYDLFWTEIFANSFPFGMPEFEKDIERSIIENPLVLLFSAGILQTDFSDNELVYCLSDRFFASAFIQKATGGYPLKYFTNDYTGVETSEEASEVL